MKKTILFLLFYLCSVSSYCQVVSIEFDRVHFAYVGMPNPITVAVENCKSSAISISTNNGTITGERGHYEYVPAHIGNTLITVKKKTANGFKVIESRLWGVKWPRMSASLGVYKQGVIPKNVVSEMYAPSVSFDDFECSQGLGIDSFTLIIIRGDKAIYNRSFFRDERYAKFDDETKSFFKTLRNKDRLLITDIMCVDPSGERRRLQSLDFVIGPDVARKEEH